MSEFKKGLIVTCKATPHGPTGTILRVAKDGSWCDVIWIGKITANGPFERWIKRMKPETIVKVDAITYLTILAGMLWS